MLKFEADEIKPEVSRKRGTLRPDHGSGAQFKGRGLQRYSVPSGRAVNQQNPALRGQTNAITGRITDQHDSDDDATPVLASEHIGNAHAGFNVLTVRKAFRRQHGLNTSRNEPVALNVTPVPVASIRSKMRSHDVKAGDTREGIVTPLNCPADYEVKIYGNGNRLIDTAPTSERNWKDVTKADVDSAWAVHTANQNALIAKMID